MCVCVNVLCTVPITAYPSLIEAGNGGCGSLACISSNITAPNASMTITTVKRFDYIIYSCTIMFIQKIRQCLKCPGLIFPQVVCVYVLWILGMKKGYNYYNANPAHFSSTTIHRVQLSKNYYKEFIPNNLLYQ